jgi:hypothetical protein
MIIIFTTTSADASTIHTYYNAADRSCHEAMNCLLIWGYFLNLHESTRLHETAWLLFDIQDEFLLA